MAYRILHQPARLWTGILFACLLATTFISCGTTFKPFPQKDTGPKIWMETGVNQLANGDFSQQEKNWKFYLAGGNATAHYSKKGAQITINTVGNVNYGVQYYYDGFRIYRGGKYTLSFTAYSTEPKGCEVRIQLNGGDYHPYVINTYTFTSEPKTYSVDFEMNEESDMTPRLAFNMGTFPDRDGALPCDVYLSNVSFVLNNTIAEKEEGNGGADFVRVNQIGYEPNAKKIAYVKMQTAKGSTQKNSRKFSVLDENKNVVYTAKLGKPVRDELAYEYTAPADFSSVTKEGTYTVKVGDNESFPFKISDDLYKPLLTDALHFFTLSRCGTKVNDALFGHDPCHVGKAYIIGTYDYSEADGGWHDAGDYGRYVVPAAKTIVDLLEARDAAGDSYKDFDILDEVKYELTWLLAMQRDDGAVYHKITCKKFPAFEMPQLETEQLYLSPVSTPATADFAGALAFASPYYRESDPAFADKLIAASEKAWAYLETHEKQSFSNPSTIETGAYSDNYDTDERFFAATALCKTTGNKKYADAAEQLRADPRTAAWKEEFGWAQMEGYGDELIANNDTLFSKSLVKAAKDALLKRADELVAQTKKSGFSLSIDEVIWGSNMVVCDNAHLLALANALTGKQLYYDAARSQVDYVLGCNPMAECYVTGYGAHSPQHPHHRPSIAMNTPMKGMLVGGPDEKLEDAFAQNLLADKPPLLCYLDNYQSFSTNEVTIYWNSSLVYAITELYFGN
jgi:endoglucanase